MYVNFNLLGSTLVDQARRWLLAKKNLFASFQLFRSDLHFITASNSLGVFRLYLSLIETLFSTNCISSRSRMQRVDSCTHTAAR